MKRMNKNIIVLLTALLLSIGSMKAQIFIADNEFEGMLRQEQDEFVLFAPVQSLDTDQFYTPIGSGLLLLTGMAGTYLLTKRKKKK